MFYNLKINSNNSEFSLESEDKSIVAREMDLYFSYMFDASSEFISKIKKAPVITNPNVKSIELVDSASSIAKNQTPQIKIEINDDQVREIEQNIYDTITQVEIEKNIEEEFNSTINDAKSEAFELNFKDDVPQLSKNDELKFESDQAPNNTENSEMLVFKNDSDEITITELKPEVKNEKLNSDKNDTSSVEDLIAQVANKLDTVNIQNSELKDDISDILNDKVDVGRMINYNPDENEICLEDENEVSTIEIKNNFETKNENKIGLNTKDNLQQDYQNKINDIFETPKQEEELSPNPPIDVPSQVVSTVDLNPEPTFEQKIQMMVDELEKQEATQSENIYQIPPQEEKIEKREIVLDEKPVTTEPKPTQQQEQEQESKQHDFSDFIKNFKCEKTLDEFLICSYYIKNIANLESFTMKAINAKLFRASGKIAGMSVLNELIGLSYIEVIDDGDIKKYSITQKGEDYFTEKFQG